jgi:hypothetical protein
MATLTQYKEHAERFGPEMILETAERELPDHQMESLRTFLKRLKKRNQIARIEKLSQPRRRRR